MKLCTLAIALFSLLATTPDTNERQWPGFRGPHRDGVAHGAKPPLTWDATKNVQWKVKLPGPGASSPIVIGDRVYVTCYSGYGYHLENGGDPKKLRHHVICVDRRTGKQIWDTSVASPLEKEAGRMNVTQHGFASPTPVSDGENVYAYFGAGGIVAVDGAGKIKWRASSGTIPKDAPEATNKVMRRGRRISLRWGAGASPLLHGNLLIVNTAEESNSLRALDKATGKVVWKRESSNLEGCYGSPVLVGDPKNPVLVLTLGGEVWGMEPATGAQIWNVETDTRTGMVPTSVADAEHVYCFGGEGHGYAIRYARPKAGEKQDPKGAHRIAWKGENAGIPSPILHDGHLLLVRSRGHGVCLVAKDGAVKQPEMRLEGRLVSVYASPVLADGRIYVVSRKRGTFVYSADGKFKLLSHNELGDKTEFNASPAPVGNQLLLRSDSYLYSIVQA